MDRNLQPATLGKLNLDPNDPVAYLDGIRDWVETQALEAITWYLKRKGPISAISKGLRLAAILLGTVGAIVPLLQNTALWTLGMGKHAAASGQYGYAILALAGACVLLDKLFGYSSNWMRYMTTVMALRRHLAEFEMDWARLRLEVEGKDLTPDQRHAMLNCIRDFRMKVVGELEQETQTWVAEFERNMAQLERRARLELEQRLPRDSAATGTQEKPASNP